MITVNKKWTAEVVEIDGEMALDLPDDLLKSMGWEVGDTLRWEKVGEAWILSKVEDDA